MNTKVTLFLTSGSQHIKLIKADLGRGKYTKTKQRKKQGRGENAKEKKMQDMQSTKIIEREKEDREGGRERKRTQGRISCRESK